MQKPFCVPYNNVANHMEKNVLVPYCSRPYTAETEISVTLLVCVARKEFSLASTYIIYRGSKNQIYGTFHIILSNSMKYQ